MSQTSKSYSYGYFALLIQNTTLYHMIKTFNKLDGATNLLQYAISALCYDVRLSTVSLLTGVTSISFISHGGTWF